MEKLIGSETVGKVLTKDSACPSLTVKERMYGFIICLILGVIFSGLSSFGLFFLTNPRKFGIIYSLSNITSICSTLFLVGPTRQLKTMFKAKRIVATLLFLFSIIGTIAFSFIYNKEEHPWHKLVMLVLLLVQFLTMVWYTLSYIPFGRTLMKKFCCAVCCSDDDEGGAKESSGGETK